MSRTWDELTKEEKEIAEDDAYYNDLDEYQDVDKWHLEGKKLDVVFAGFCLLVASIEAMEKQE